MKLITYVDTLFDRQKYSEEIDKLKRNIEHILSPKTTNSCYGEIIKGYPNIPPQPCTQTISSSWALTEEKYRYAFIYLDQIVSLMPSKLLKELATEGWRETHDNFEDRLIKEQLNLLQNNLYVYPEDAEKKHILLAVPSNRQFKEVLGRWEQWVWRRYTLNGEKTPDENGWMRDIMNIVEALNQERVRCIIVVDKYLPSNKMEELKDKISHSPLNKIIKIDLGEGYAKIGYVRDQSLTITEQPFIGNMALKIRAGEERKIIDIYDELGLEPVIRIRWSQINNGIIKANAEGGNFILIQTDNGKYLLTGIGVRGSNLAALVTMRKVLSEDIHLIGIPLSGYIKKWSETGAVHLDVVLTYLGDLNGTYYAVIDPMRVGFYSVIEIEKNLDISIKTIPQLFHEMGVYLDEIPHSGSKITMANALNLGKGKLVVDRYNKEVNKYLVREFGIDLIQIEIPHIEAGGGGVRCSTKEIWEIHR